MQVEKSAIVALVKAAVSKTEQVKVAESGLLAYYLDDITVILKDTERPSFFGASIEVLGRSFHIIDDFNVMIDDTDSENPDESVFVLEDESVIKFLNDFIKIRAELLSTFGA